jgi:hypothetical protein
MLTCSGPLCLSLPPPWCCCAGPGSSPSVKGVVTAVLVDPVDNTRFSPEGPANPSAIRALTGRNKTAALIGERGA